MLKELKRLDLEKLSTRKELWQKFKERESRFLEKCIKQGRMLKSKVKEETLLRTMLTLDLLFTLQLPEMVSLWIKKLTSMKFNLKLYLLIKELRSLVDLFQLMFSSPKLALTKLNIISPANFLEEM
jgi:hypothetical protein